jgi:hypothetical protein
MKLTSDQQSRIQQLNRQLTWARSKKEKNRLLKLIARIVNE